MKSRDLRAGQVWRDDTDCIMITDVGVDDYVKIKGHAVIGGVTNVNYSTYSSLDGEWTEFPTLIFDPPVF